MRMLAAAALILGGAPPQEAADPVAALIDRHFEAKGTMTLDVESGLAISHEGAGSVRARYKGVDPNTGETHELKIDLEITSKFATKE